MVASEDTLVVSECNVVAGEDIFLMAEELTDRWT